MLIRQQRLGLFSPNRTAHDLKRPTGSVVFLRYPQKIIEILHFPEETDDLVPNLAWIPGHRVDRYSRQCRAVNSRGDNPVRFRKKRAK
jgi:hypothetical protein